jgi:hypothetical protein
LPILLQLSSLRLQTFNICIIIISTGIILFHCPEPAATAGANFIIFFIFFSEEKSVARQKPEWQPRSEKRQQRHWQDWPPEWLIKVRKKEYQHSNTEIKNLLINPKTYNSTTVHINMSKNNF